MANEKALPVIPEKVPMLDSSGLLSRPWSIWFRQAFSRMGGADAPSNNEIQGSIEESSEQVSAQFENQDNRISALETAVSNSSLGVGPVL